MHRNFLKTDQLTVAFGGIVALSNVTLSIAEGRTTAILGPNGAGKTTLFNAIAGAVRPTGGRVFFQGADITKASPSRRCHSGIARTFQITQPFSGLSVRENVMVPLAAGGMSMKQAREEASTYIDFVGLNAKAEDPARVLSTGQRKRLELARALSTHPKLLLLDEVTGGVDRPSIPELLNVIRRLREERNITIVVVEHNMEVLLGLADDAFFLNRGEVIVEGSIAEVADHETVRRIYLGDADAAA
ncbi:ABC transporter ATP-binding protein [Tianweitania sp. BSSL-BM11]|uniref:ABC transporter ATP-binding protein n=1 Tax=Tianweitania aestuarii TaxID=2814886 RepID=A0ABS5RYE8_9HYPH|nr:ABC transporter ATP-binding protein [Tianweitania aestuarii]MBS9721352.1 ABC transporter ATP-binding protein [Tianweitania aestuarii]